MNELLHFHSEFIEIKGIFLDQSCSDYSVNSLMNKYSQANSQTFSYIEARLM